MRFKMVRTCFTCWWLNGYFQVNGSFHGVITFAFPMAAVCSLVIFRDVKNREEELILTLAARFLVHYFVFFTAFQGNRIVV